MPRRNRQDRNEPRPLTGALADQRSVSGRDGEWLVRTVPGSQATKTYRCPGCDHEINPGTPHVVAWPAEAHGSVADRRHWHTGCWKRRPNR